jgi:hypothetical protein
VLQDPARVLVAGEPPRRLSTALTRLHSVLDDLDAALQPA